MIASLNLAIPAGHVLHWKHRPDGVMEIRIMLFLTPANARWAAKMEALRGAVPTPPE